MKFALPGTLILAMVLVFPFGAEAKKKGKKDDATPAPADPSNPVAALSPYIVNLDELLALNRGKKGSEPFFEQASGQILTLRQEFVVELEKAPDNLKGLYGAAIKTSDLIGAALEDRGKVVGDLRASKAVNPDGKLQESAKKDNLEQGIHGDGLAKGVGAIVERDRERQAIAKGEAQNAANGNALTAMAANEWNARATAWHQRIAGAFSEIK